MVEAIAKDPGTDPDDIRPQMVAAALTAAFSSLRDRDLAAPSASFSSEQAMAWSTRSSDSSGAASKRSGATDARQRRYQGKPKWKLRGSHKRPVTTNADPQNRR
jgi:hypothetical protein